MNGQRGFGAGGPQRDRGSGGPPRGEGGGGGDLGWAEELGRRVQNLNAVAASTLVDVAEEMGKRLAEGGLKMNQVRRFLSEVRSIEAEFRQAKDFVKIADRVTFLRPKLAYAAAREDRARPLLFVLNPAIKSAEKGPEEFKQLVSLIEAIVAYYSATARRS